MACCLRGVLVILVALALSACSFSVSVPLEKTSPDAPVIEIELPLRTPTSDPAPTATPPAASTSTPETTVTATDMPEPTATPSTPSYKGELAPALGGCIRVPSGWRLVDADKSTEESASYEFAGGMVVLGRLPITVVDGASADAALQLIAEGLAEEDEGSDLRLELDSESATEVETEWGTVYESSCAFRATAVSVPCAIAFAPRSEGGILVAVSVALATDQLPVTLMDQIRQVLGTFQVGEVCEVAAAPEAEPAVEVTDWVWYLGDYGLLYIEGEVANRTGEPVEFVELQFKLLDGSEKFLGTASGYANSLRIGAGQTSIFEVMTTAPSGVEWVVLTNVNWLPAR